MRPLASHSGPIGIEWSPVVVVIGSGKQGHSRRNTPTQNDLFPWESCTLQQPGLFGSGPLSRRIAESCGSSWLLACSVSRSRLPNQRTPKDYGLAAPALGALASEDLAFRLTASGTRPSSADTHLQALRIPWLRGRSMSQDRSSTAVLPLDMFRGQPFGLP
jgi:hypothetical protein